MIRLVVILVFVLLILYVVNIHCVLLQLAVLEIEATGPSGGVLELLARIVLIFILLSVLHALDLSLQLLDLSLERLLVLGGCEA